MGLLLVDQREHKHQMRLSINGSGSAESRAEAVGVFASQIGLDGQKMAALMKSQLLLGATQSALKVVDGLPDHRLGFVAKLIALPLYIALVPFYILVRVWRKL